MDDNKAFGSVVPQNPVNPQADIPNPYQAPAAPRPPIGPTGMPVSPRPQPAPVVTAEEQAEIDERRAAAVSAAVESEMAKPINTAVPLQDLADSLLNINHPAPVAPVTPAEPVAQVLPITPEPKFAPANPPTKTISFTQEVRPPEITHTPGELQSAVSAAATGDAELAAQIKKTIAVPGTATAPTAPHVPKINPNVKPIRTYESDVAEVMARSRVSSASMVIAENRRQEAEGPTAANTTGKNVPTMASILASTRLTDQREQSHIGKNIFILLLCLIFIGGGITGGYYFWKQSPLATTIPEPTTTRASQPQNIPGIIQADSQVIVSIDNQNANAVRTRVEAEIAKAQPASTVREIILAKTKQGSVGRASAADMLTVLDLGAPDILTRSLTDSWMLGVYADANGSKSTFVIATTNFFQNAFAGVLQWESVMPDDLKLYIASEQVSGIANIVSTSTAAQNPPTNTIHGQFQDRIIRNRDVRAFVTNSGQTLFLYSFVDSSHIVITSSDTGLTEIINRLEKQTLVR